MKNVVHKIVHEFTELIVVFLLIAPFYLAAASYRVYLIGEPRGLVFRFGTTLFNALVLAKIVLIGELAHLGKRTERRPLLIPVLCKAVMFAVLAMIFHILEAVIHDALHGQSFSSAVQTVMLTETREITGFGVIMFFGFIPFFALEEIRRLLGTEKFRAIFLGERMRHVDGSAPRSHTVTPAAN